MTACGKCKFRRFYLVNYVCVFNLPDEFDFLTGMSVKVLRLGLVYVLCSIKNKGNCPDFQDADSE